MNTLQTVEFLRKHSRPTYQPIDFNVCRDCFETICCPEENPDIDPIELNNIQECIEQLQDEHHGQFTGSGELTDEFSWTRCECCGSSLGGERFDVVLLSNEE